MEVGEAARRPRRGSKRGNNAHMVLKRDGEKEGEGSEEVVVGVAVEEGEAASVLRSSAEECPHLDGASEKQSAKEGVRFLVDTFLQEEKVDPKEEGDTRLQRSQQPQHPQQQQPLRRKEKVNSLADDLFEQCAQEVARSNHSFDIRKAQSSDEVKTRRAKIVVMKHHENNNHNSHNPSLRILSQTLYSKSFSREVQSPRRE